MDFKKYTLVLTICCMVLGFYSCEKEEISPGEINMQEYVSSFIKEICVVSPAQDWKNIDITTIDIDLGSRDAHLVTVYVSSGEAHFPVAMLGDVSGRQSVRVYVPQEASSILVDVDGDQYASSLGQAVSCIGAPSTPAVLQKRAYMWTMASEDCSRMNDFDFNDIVLGISHLTTNIANAELQSDGTMQLSTVSGRLSALQFTPLAVSSTTPTYINFKFKRTNGDIHDIVLSPGIFDLTGETASVPEAKEYHTWFGAYRTVQRINTGIGVKQPVNQQYHSAWVIMPEGTNINLGGVLTENIYTAQPKECYNKSLSASNSSIFYVTINGAPECENAGSDEILGSETGTTYLVPLPSLGNTPLSFLVSNNSPTPWRWSKEYVHILDSYPTFKTWVADPEVYPWADNGKVNFLADPLSLTAGTYLEALASFTQP